MAGYRIAASASSRPGCTSMIFTKPLTSNTLWTDCCNEQSANRPFIWFSFFARISTRAEPGAADIADAGKIEKNRLAPFVDSFHHRRLEVRRV